MAEPPVYEEVVIAAQERLTLRNVYLYLVCLITLVISVFAAVNLVRSAVELAYPDPGYYGYEPYVEPAGSKQPRVSKAEQRRREDAARDSQRRQAVLGLVGSGTTLLIAGPIYLYHWRRVQTELPARPEPSPAGGPPMT
ncbi:MAG TPA: hypothetical protein VFK52_09810 [Nocardioidaceae bacterium]|nr:hypothetical protein [Nocardioidaceae bacterium]